MLAVVNAGNVSITLHGVTFNKLDMVMSWDLARNVCSQGLLWFKNNTEKNQLITDLPITGDVWLAARYAVDAWPNGHSFAADLEMDSPPDDR